MKLKKGILLTLLTILIIAMLSAFTMVQAATGSKTLNLKMIRSLGYGYQLGNSRKNVWKIYDTTNDRNDTIYCLKGGPGFGSTDFFGDSPHATTYTQYFDMKSDSIPSTYQSALPQNSTTYKSLLWVLDQCYVAPKTGASTATIQQAAAVRTALINAAINYAVAEGYPTIQDDGYEFEFVTDDDIDVVQQLAIWYFTNPTGDYHVEDFELYLSTVSGTETPLSDFNRGYRADACQALFDYLVNTAQSAEILSNYNPTSISIQPVQFANTTPTFTNQGSRVIVGPYRLQENSDISYSMIPTVKDGNGNTVSDVIYQNASGNTISNLVGQDFYLSIPSSINTSQITVTINGSYFKSTATYWSVANPSSSDQPVVILDKEVVSFSDEKVATPPPVIIVKNFDLALRKYITKVNGTAVANTRTPVIDLSSLTSGTTATYQHRKDPLLVANGNTVTYNLTVYNEGEKTGRATTIIDQLPTGLALATTGTVTSTKGNIYTITYDEATNRVTLTTTGTNNLNAYVTGTLDSDTIELECTVTATTSTTGDQVLTNVAWIAVEYDAEDNKTITTTIGEDRDSEPGTAPNVTASSLVTTGVGYTGGNTYTSTEALASSTTYYVGQQDDDDFEKLILPGKYFDLSLRKFITSISHNGTTTTYNRAPVVDTTPLKNGATTATYTHSKTPVSVDLGDEVIYTIRVYNEGQVDGYITEITDHLPAQLEFIVNDELNARYGWKVSTDGRTVTTDITSPTTASSANRDSIYAQRTTTADKVLLTAFDGGNSLNYIDVQIKCKVKQESNLYEKITNIADITGFTDSQGNTVTDRDSKEKNVTLPTDATLPNYKDTEIERGDSYIPGQQDDDDFEKLVLQRFDLALRKFITGVNDKEIINRAPVFTKVSDTEYKYEHTKEPVEVANGNTVIYTLRIFNEGNVAGYAQKVKDNLPEGIEFLPDHEINKQYAWVMYREDGTETEEVSEASYIETNYLSKEQESVTGENLINAFNPNTMTMPDYKDIKIAFLVTEPDTSDRIVINTAQISDDADENGKPINDIDSTPDNNVEDEDDIDIEKIKVKYFDLSLRKWVTESIVTYDGKTTVTKTGNKAEDDPETPAKVEIRGSRIDKTTVKFKFNIKVTNEGEIAGYVKELKDYIPEGLKFVASDNPDWEETEVANEVVTDQLKDTILEPGESATVSITLTWLNNKNNLGQKVNWAEISKDANEYDAPDIDSTPNNNTIGEDDIDEAPVVLSVVTGNTPTYITLIFASLSMLTVGIVLIKKFVI